MKYIKEIVPYIIIIVTVVFIRTFIITPVRVDGLSMYPTLKDGEILLLKKFDKSIERFDIVVVNFGKTKIVKRVIGLPGEVIEYKNNKLYINNKEIKEEFLNEDIKTSNFNLDMLKLEKIPENHYFVVGDNRNDSTDSRILGVISKDDIMGVTNFSIFPFDTFGSIK